MKIQTPENQYKELSSLNYKMVLFQVENHSVGHLMPKASQPWEKNGIT